MKNLISEDVLENSVPIEKMAGVSIMLSSGNRIKVTNTVTNIIGLFQFVEDPKNRFLNIGGVKINISQIVSMQWIKVSSYTADGEIKD